MDIWRNPVHTASLCTRKQPHCAEGVLAANTNALRGMLGLRVCRSFHNVGSKLAYYVFWNFHIWYNLERRECQLVEISVEHVVLLGHIRYTPMRRRPRPGFPQCGPTSGTRGCGVEPDRDTLRVKQVVARRGDQLALIQADDTDGR